MRRFLALLSFGIVGLAVLVSASPVFAQPAAEQPGYLKYVSRNTLGLTVVRPKAITEHTYFGQLQEAQPELIEEFLNGFKERFGAPFSECEIFVNGQLDRIYSKSREFEIEQSYSMAVFSSPVSQEAVLADDEPDEKWEEITVDGATFFKKTYAGTGVLADLFNDPVTNYSVAIPQANIVIRTAEVSMSAVLGADGQNEWAKRLSRIKESELSAGYFGNDSMNQLREDLQELPGLPPPISTHIDALGKVSLAEYHLSLVGDNLLTVSFHSANADDAAAVGQSAEELLAFGKAMLAPIVSPASGLGFEEAHQDAVSTTMESISVTTDGTAVQLTIPMPDEETRQALLDLVRVLTRG